jgi:hypothetical protein
MLFPENGDSCKFLTHKLNSSSLFVRKIHVWILSTYFPEQHNAIPTSRNQHLPLRAESNRFHRIRISPNIPTCLIYLSLQCSFLLPLSFGILISIQNFILARFTLKLIGGAADAEDFSRLRVILNAMVAAMGAIRSAGTKASRSKSPPRRMPAPANPPM